MITDTIAATDPTSATQQDTLTVLLQDREWVDAQFATIMIASGFGDRVIVGVLPDPPHGERRRIRDGSPSWRDQERVPPAALRSRIRSPPVRS